MWSNEEITPQKIEVYHAVLGRFPVEAMREAAIAYLCTGKFFPRPADLLELANRNRNEVPAGDSWELVLKQVRKHGFTGWESVSFADETIMGAVRQVGWRRICLDERPDLVRRDFEQALAALRERHRKEVQTGEVGLDALGWDRVPLPATAKHVGN